MCWWLRRLISKLSYSCWRRNQKRMHERDFFLKKTTHCIYRSDQVPWLVPTQSQCIDPIPKCWRRRQQYWLRLRDFEFRMQILGVWGGCMAFLARWQGEHYCFWSCPCRHLWMQRQSTLLVSPFFFQRTVHKGKGSHGETSLQNRNLQCCHTSK